MADELDTGIKGPGLRPNQISVLCSCAKHFTPTVPLFTQEYECTSKFSGKSDKM